MKAYLISDTHLADGSLADDANGKRGELRALCRRVITEKARLYHGGDLLDLWATNEKGILAEKDNRRTFELLNKALTHTVAGNHDRKLQTIDPYLADYLHYGHSAMIQLDGEPCWLEHGHAFDPSWQRGAAVKLGAKLLYCIEGHLWQGADEWLAEQLHRFQTNARRKANDKDANRLPYWWGALERSRMFPACHTFIFGHSHHLGIECFPNDKGEKLTYINLGTWARDDCGKQKMDVSVYETGKGWKQCQAGELI